MNITQFIAPEFLVHVRERFTYRAEDELGTVEEIDIIAKDGRCVALEVSTRVISRDGRPVEIQGIAVPSVLRGNPESNVRPQCLDETFSSQILLAELKNLN